MKKERKKQVQKILAIFLVMMLVIPTFFSVFGAINENYQGTPVEKNLRVDGNENSNILSKAVFWLINTIASIGEYLISSFADVMASTNDKGTSIMPWADAIIYNGVPALDVNFINPSEGSFSSIISEVVAKLYYTIFSISITFFTVAVLIMAIKLATTAIAAEKARYKESVANFIISLILIFSIHYFISFCFYLNESLVKIAFAIGEKQLSGALDIAQSAAQQDIEAIYKKALEETHKMTADDRYTNIPEDFVEYTYDKLFDETSSEYKPEYRKAAETMIFDLEECGYFGKRRWQ